MNSHHIQTQTTMLSPKKPVPKTFGWQIKNWFFKILIAYNGLRENSNGRLIFNQSRWMSYHCIPYVWAFENLQWKDTAVIAAFLLWHIIILKVVHPSKKSSRSPCCSTILSSILLRIRCCFKLFRKLSILPDFYNINIGKISEKIKINENNKNSNTVRTLLCSWKFVSPPL